jgi:hypothetical protein
METDMSREEAIKLYRRAIAESEQLRKTCEARKLRRKIEKRRKKNAKS